MKRFKINEISHNYSYEFYFHLYQRNYAYFNWFDYLMLIIISSAIIPIPYLIFSEYNPLGWNLEGHYQSIDDLLEAMEEIRNNTDDKEKCKTIYLD